MIQLPPKKRVPELKLKKLPVIDTAPKRTHTPNLPSVTTVVDGIPIIEYICDKRSPIFLDSCDSSPTGTQAVSYFSPEPVKNQFFEDDVRTDYNVALKKPTRWDSGPRKNFRLYVKTPQREQRSQLVTESTFQLKPRDPRVKTFRKHHRQAAAPRKRTDSFQFDENLMDVSSPEYKPPSPFSPSDTSHSPKIAFDSKFPKRRTGFFDSESECSDPEFSGVSSLYQILPISASVGRPPEYTESASLGPGEQKQYFWDSSSGDESNDLPVKTESVRNIKEVTPDQQVAYSSDDTSQAVYKKTDTNPPRATSFSSLTDQNSGHKSPPRVRRERSPVPEMNARRKDQLEKRNSVCIYCGDRGHASNDTCPLRVCSLCFKIGHNFRECKSRGKNRPPKCSRCRISCHEKNRCGEVWRQCHNTTFLPNDYPQCAKGNSYIVTMEIQAFRVDQLRSNLYCCNCASYGHVFFQCETPHPSRYFYIPLIGHYDIPLSVQFREIRDNSKKSLLLTSLLPKPYHVVSQNFWGDGNWNEDCDSVDTVGCQANWTSSATRKERHFIDSDCDISPIKSPRLASSMSDLEKMSLSPFPMSFERTCRSTPFYGRDLLNARTFLNIPHYTFPGADRRQLTPLVYAPEGEIPTVPSAKEEEKRARERLDTKKNSNRDDKRAHASFTQTVHNNNNNNKYDKHVYKLKQRNLKARDRDKQKFALKDKRNKKHFEDARECINRNRTKRQTQQHNRLSRSEEVGRSKGAVKRRSSPKRSAKKDHSPVTPDPKVETGNGEQLTNEDTYMFIDEVH